MRSFGGSHIRMQSSTAIPPKRKLGSRRSRWREMPRRVALKRSRHALIDRPRWKCTTRGRCEGSAACSPSRSRRRNITEPAAFYSVGEFRRASIRCPFRIPEIPLRCPPFAFGLHLQARLRAGHLNALYRWPSGLAAPCSGRAAIFASLRASSASRAACAASSAAAAARSNTATA